MPWIQFLAITITDRPASDGNLCSSVLQLLPTWSPGESEKSAMDGHSSSSTSSEESRRPTSAHSKSISQFAANWNAAVNASPVDLSVPSSVASSSSNSSAVTRDPNNQLSAALPVFSNAGLTSGLISSFGKRENCLKRTAHWLLSSCQVPLTPWSLRIPS